MGIQKWKDRPWDAKSDHPLYKTFPIPEIEILLQYTSSIPKGGKFLELGTHLGRTTREVAAWRPDIHCVTVDHFNFDQTKLTDYYKEIIEIVLNGKMYDYKMVCDFLKPYSNIEIIKSEIGKYLYNTNITFNLIFLDAPKNYEKLIETLKLLDKNLKTGGYIAIHDIWEDIDIPLAIKDIIGKDKRYIEMENFRLENSTGIGIYKKEKNAK